jgi:hypothetical protein
MATSRDTCPDCQSPVVLPLQLLNVATWVDYFRCVACGHEWNVPKGQNAPVRSVVSANPVVSRPRP